MKVQSIIFISAAFAATLAIGFCGAMMFLDRGTQNVKKAGSDYVDEVRKNPNIIPYDPAIDNSKEEALRREAEEKKEKERIRQEVIRKERKRSDFLVNWKTLLRCDYMGGRWFNSWLQGGGFKEVNIMFYNDSEYTVDEVSVRFRVEMRNFDRVCHDRTHTFINVPPHTAKSIAVSNDCGMRPPQIGIVSIRIKEIEVEQSNDWNEVYVKEFHN